MLFSRVIVKASVALLFTLPLGSYGGQSSPAAAPKHIQNLELWSYKTGNKESLSLNSSIFLFVKDNCSPCDQQIELLKKCSNPLSIKIVTSEGTAYIRQLQKKMASPIFQISPEKMKSLNVVATPTWIIKGQKQTGLQLPPSCQYH